MRGNGCYIAGSNWFVEIIWGKILENKNVDSNKHKHNKKMGIGT